MCASQFMQSLHHSLVTSILLSNPTIQIAMTTQIPWPFPDFGPYSPTFPWSYPNAPTVPGCQKFQRSGNADYYLISMRKESKQRGERDLSFDRVALTVNHGVWCNDAVRDRVRLNYFELNGSHAASHQENVALVNRPICLEEVRLQVHVKQVAASKNYYYYFIIIIVQKSMLWTKKKLHRKIVQCIQAIERLCKVPKISLISDSRRNTILKHFKEIVLDSRYQFHIIRSH